MQVNVDRVRRKEGEGRREELRVGRLKRGRVDREGRKGRVRSRKQRQEGNSKRKETISENAKGNRGRSKAEDRR